MKIYAKLLDARKAMSFEKVRKPGMNFDVLDGDMILQMVGEALTANDILFVPSIVDAEITWQPIGNKTVQHALAEIAIRFIDVETGDVMEATTHGSALSYDGKALGAAQSYGIKYFFARMFLKGASDFDDEAPLEAPTTRKTTPKTNDSAQEGTTVDDITWTRDTARKAGLLKWATEFWTMEGEPPPAEPHVINRLCVALGLPSAKGKLSAFYDLIELYEGSDKDAAAAIEAYQPKGD